MEWLPTSVFLPGESRGQRSLVYYNPWDHKATDMIEWLSMIWRIMRDVIYFTKFVNILPKLTSSESNQHFKLWTRYQELCLGSLFRNEEYSWFCIHSYKSKNMITWGKFFLGLYLLLWLAHLNQDASSLVSGGKEKRVHHHAISKLASKNKEKWTK